MLVQSHTVRNLDLNLILHLNFIWSIPFNSEFLIRRDCLFHYCTKWRTGPRNPAHDTWRRRGGHTADLQTFSGRLPQARGAALDWQQGPGPILRKADTVSVALSQTSSKKNNREDLGQQWAGVGWRGSSKGSFATNTNGHQHSRLPSPQTSFTCQSNRAAHQPPALPVLGCPLLTCMEMTAACHGLHERPHLQQ